MKKSPMPSRLFVVVFLLLANVTAFAGTDVWTGGGGANNLFWLSTANWNPAGIPQSGDTLFFTNTIGLINSNNIPNGNFSGITFATPSGAFALNGNSVTLANITDLQAVTPQTINLPITDNGPANLNLNVVANGVLNLNNVISGTGNLTNSGAGRVNLNGSNTITGSLIINGGVVTVSQETNLPLAPITPTPGNIIINGGTLQALAGFTINSNRGIAVGPTSGNGQGTISVNTEATTPNQYTTLYYGGAITNNGAGTGGLTKLGFGNLVLFGANTYTGTTSNEVGTLTLDFSKPGAPANNIISSNSPLVFGGSISGAGVTNFAQMVMTNSAAGTVSQTFNGTHVTVGSAIIRVASGSGTANLTLGALDHDAGGVLAIMPPTLRGGSGNITTTSTNLNGIIGGWATISDGNTMVAGWPASTNWACIDANSNIVNYANFTVYSSGYVSSIMAYSNNILIPSTVTGDLTNDVDNTNGIWATYDVNTITIDRADSGWTFQIGVSNILRLGTSGGIFRRTYGTSTKLNFGTGSGELTAGGPNIDTPGDIVLTTYQPDSANNNLALISPIVDNGAGAVTVVKAGSGYASLNGINSYSGGTYIEGGRLRWNGGSYGSGPIYIFPGGYTYVNGGTVITNAWFISGNGSQQEAGLGAIRYGPGPNSGAYFTGPITLIGDAEIGGQGSGAIVGPISGPFKLIIGCLASATGDTTLANTNNSWSGDTLLTARNNAGVNTLTLSNSEVIPNGFGKGNVTMQGFSTGQFQWRLNGFNETINGLSTIGTPANCIITNNASSTTSILTLGDNDQSGTFGGFLKAGAGILALTKIGAGVETLTAANTYTGDTTISNGVLQLSGSGLIANSANVNIRGGTFDVSGVNYAIPSGQAINVSGGTFFISSASAGGPVNLTNSTLKVTALSVGTPNLAGATINLGGSLNLVQPTSIPLIDIYPKTFVIASYTTLNGDATTLAASLPAGGFPPYGGFVSNDTADKEIVLVMTNGPITPSLTWAGFNYSTHTLDSNWNFVDTDWTNKPAKTSASYTDGSLLTFDDSGATGTVILGGAFAPAGVTVANTNLNYTFSGIGSIYGTNGVTKLGSGKLTLDETGADSYNGLSISGGIVQMGINDTGGSLGTNTVGNNGTLVFNRVNSTLLISNSISGSGGILVSNASGTTTVLSGNNGGYSGSVYVQTGQTLAEANANALSSTNGTVTIPTGATLDVSGLGAGANTLTVGKNVSVSGAGVDSVSGAIVNNTTTNQQNALLRVTLTANTTFGGTGTRWDIRGTPAQPGVLSTGGNAYNLTKVGSFFFSIANIAVDSALNNVDVQGGTLEINGSTTGLGTSGVLTIESGATLQIFNMTNTTLGKNIVLNGDSIDNTLNVALGNNNTISGPITLNGSTIVNGANNTTLTLSGVVGGSGSLVKNGTNATLIFAGNNTFSGATTINDGTVLFKGISSGSQLTENISAAFPLVSGIVVVGGRGTNGAPVDIEDVLWPGVAGTPATFGAGDGVSEYAGDSNAGGALVFGYSGQGVPEAIFSLGSSTTAGGGVNDLIRVRGDFNGNSAKVKINPLASLSTSSPYTLVTYSGNKLGSFSSTIGVVDSLQPTRYSFSLTYDTANKQVLLNVLTGAGNLVWNNNSANGLWDTNSINWLNTGTSANDQFYQLDAVTFNDSIGGSAATVTLNTTNLLPASVTVNNSSVAYTFAGTGSIGGPVGLLKQGSGTLTISNANSFTGAVTVQGGTLAANANNALGGASTVTVQGGTLLAATAAALGTDATPLIITNAGIFNINSQILTNKTTVIVSGAGDGNGAIVNNVNPVTAGSLNALQNVTLAGNTTFGGNSRWDLRTGAGVLSTGGNPFSLTKVGTNYIAFDGVAIDTNLGNIDIRGGTLSFQQATTSMGNSASNLTVEAGATLSLYNSTTNIQSFTKQFVLNGDGATGTITNENGTTTLNGNMSLSGNCLIGGPGTALNNNCVISGSGSLTKVAGGTLALTTNEIYTGNTTISGGTLSLQGNGSINSSASITVLGGTVDAAGRANNTLTLSGSQTLSGYGTVGGTLTVPSGTTLTVGTNGAVGKLTVTTNANLSGTLNMDLDKGNTTNDVLVVNGQVNYGGTLNLNNLSGTLAGGDSFKLFTAGTYGGSSFAGITPAHPNNDSSLNWDTSLLNVSGIIKVVSSAPSTPVITSISLNGNTLTFSATNGSANGQYALLSTTNVALPLAQWTSVFTNNFDGSGDINLSTNVVNPANAQTFYILQVLP
jgi:fibronectin-binding autotransporter adhesin